MVEKEKVGLAVARATLGAVTGATVSTLPSQKAPTIYIVDEKFKEELAKILEKAVEKGMASMGKTRIAMTLPEITMALMAEGLMEPYSTVKTFTLNPGQTVVYEGYVPKGKVYLAGAVKIDTDPDLVNSVAFYFDSDVPRFVDPAVTSSRYRDMIYYINIGTLLKVERFFKVVVKNNSPTTTSTYSFMFIWGAVETTVWKRIVEKFFKVMREEFGL
ncbi:MAG: hypothetical protein QXM02_07830 [Thermoproteota archaeon]